MQTCSIANAFIILFFIILLLIELFQFTKYFTVYFTEFDKHIYKRFSFYETRSYLFSP